MANYAELTIDIGTDFQETIIVQDDASGNLLNLTSYIVTSQVRRGYYSQNTSANIICTIVDAANGNLSLTMASSVTSNITPGRYVYDVKAVTPANTVQRLLEGTITATPRVTV